jgi:hypothetical protein
MNRIRSKTIWLLPLLLVLAFSLAACSDDDDDDDDNDTPEPVTATYRVTVTNLTNNQPLSPPVVVLHTNGYQAWMAGMAATDGLEWLAEAGDGSVLLNEARTDPAVSDTGGIADPVGPGGEDSVILTVNRDSDLQVTVATMLVNTNDAFTGMTGLPVGRLADGETMTRYAMAYDAGTEANTEMAVTIPGPAGRGQGYAPERDDIRDIITVHPGVVTMDDGLITSALDESHRFLNPVAMLTITRID